MDRENSEKLSFWVSRALADAVRQKILDHKRATRERITITDICTEALQKFINPKEGNEMKNCPVCHTPYQAETGIQVGSKVVCQSCFENYSRTCTDCGEYFFPRGDESRCRKCSGVRRNNAI